MTLSLWFKLLIRFVIVCHWVTMVTSGENCGINPLRPILTLAKETGEPVSTVLTLLRDVHSPFHDALVREYENYSACVGLMETGYFRKRTSSDLPLVVPSWISDRQYFDHPELEGSGQGRAVGIRDLFSMYMDGAIGGGGEEEEDVEEDGRRMFGGKSWKQHLRSNGAPTAFVPNKLTLLMAFRNLISNNNRNNQ